MELTESAPESSSIAIKIKNLAKYMSDSIGRFSVEVLGMFEMDDQVKVFI